MNFLLRKYYNYLNNIDMVLLRTSYMYGGFLEYYFRLQFSVFWSMHERMLILRCISPPKKKQKTEVPPEKKLT